MRNASVPDSHEVYLAFAAHWGFTPLPTQPRHPQENGKQERSGGYVKDNALKGRRFDSLAAQNAFLQHWNRTIARLRIHGTTRRQVWTHFVETEQRALQPLAATAFPIFTSTGSSAMRVGAGAGGAASTRRRTLHAHAPAEQRKRHRIETAVDFDMAVGVHRPDLAAVLTAAIGSVRRRDESGYAERALAWRQGKGLVRLCQIRS